ncbi:MAG: hypothetical protein LBS81_02995 [Endomicrobium sp.]|jgi:hypothetical protein|nr:hypothetical protein [Endomicrobium sp.]
MLEEKNQMQEPFQIKSEETGTEIDSIDFDVIKKNEKVIRTYDVEGLLIGGTVGFIIGITISFDIVFAIEIGMFLGLIIGTRIKKNKDKTIL